MDRHRTSLFSLPTGHDTQVQSNASGSLVVGLKVQAMFPSVSG